LRLQRARAGGERIESPRAFCRRWSCGSHSTNSAAAGATREWLPELLVTSSEEDSAHRAEMGGLAELHAAWLRPAGTSTCTGLRPALAPAGTTPSLRGLRQVL
jgi:hypothetical protein